MKRICLVVVLVACGGRKDDCEKLIDKLTPFMKEKGEGEAWAAQRDKNLDACRKNPKMKDDPSMKCVLAASDNAAITACMDKGVSDYKARAKQPEAKLNLDRIGKNAKMHYVTNAEFPKGNSATLPDKSCCPKCDAVPAEKWAADPVWNALDFSFEDPPRFQYHYESADGKSFTATAVGDLDCDETTVTYTIKGSIDSSGNPVVELVEPTNPD